MARHGLFDIEVERELERQRSFGRSRVSAVQWQEGDSRVDLGEVRRELERAGWAPTRTLRAHQEQGLLHALSATNAANFSVPGSGKTATALAAATMHLAAGTVDVILVVGPLASFRPWEREVELALGQRVHAVRARGSSATRRSLYEKLAHATLLLVSGS